MRIIILFILALSLGQLNAQKHTGNHQKEINNSLIKKLVNKDSIYNLQIIKLKMEATSLRDSVKTIQNVLTDINTHFFKSIFVSNYMHDSSYFMSIDLADLDTVDIYKGSTIARSMCIGGFSDDTLRIIKKLLDFNINYIEMYRIKTGILSQKFDSLKVANAIAILDSLPKINQECKLSISKVKLRSLLAEYGIRNCSLKEKLDKLKQAHQSPIITAQYGKLKSDEKYKYSPYFLSILNKIIGDVANYKPDDLICPVH